jgi:hypothetical protein
MPESNIERWLNLMLEDEDFETLLERFDLTPEEVFVRMLEVGMIDEELLNELMRTGD